MHTTPEQQVLLFQSIRASRILTVRLVLHQHCVPQKAISVARQTGNTGSRKTALTNDLVPTRIQRRSRQWMRIVVDTRKRYLRWIGEL